MDIMHSPFMYLFRLSICLVLSPYAFTEEKIMNIRPILILLICGIFLYRFLKKVFGSVKIHNNSIICFSGGLGSGKTFLSVKYIVNRYCWQYIAWKLKLRKQKPYVVSNIPIRLRKNEWAHVLKREHLLMEEALPEGAIVFCDEMGNVASQYDFDNPNVLGKFNDFIRYFRHYINGKFIYTDQSLQNVIFCLKRRTSINYSLENFKKSGLLLPTYHIDCSILKVQDGEVVNTNNVLNNKYERVYYFYGLIPRFGIGWRHYDTRCYSDNYHCKKAFNDTLYWSSYKTDYIIDLSAKKEEIEAFKKSNKYNKKFASAKTTA